MKIYKTELDTINYNEMKLLIPMVMIEVAQRIYSNDSQFSCSIECMWSLVTKCKMPLTKAKRTELISLFEDYFNDGKSLEWDVEITFDYYNKENDFILINMNDIVSIFTTEKRFDKIANLLYTILNFHSYMNGKCIYMSKTDLINYEKEQYTNIDITDSTTWFYNLTTKQLESLASDFVAYPSIEDLLTKRYNNDTNKFEEQLMAEVNFNKYIKQLTELGIICKVQTNYGQYGNKVVFCRCEHKEVVEALYERLSKHKDMAKTNKKQKDNVKQPKEEPKPFGIPRGGEREAHDYTPLEEIESGCTSEANKKVHEKVKARDWNVNTIEHIEIIGKEIEFDLTDLYIQPKCSEKVNRDKKW